MVAVQDDSGCYVFASNITNGKIYRANFGSSFLNPISSWTDLNKLESPIVSATIGKLTTFKNGANFHLFYVDFSNDLYRADFGNSWDPYLGI
jgi:hypothetical protein